MAVVFVFLSCLLIASISFAPSGIGLSYSLQLSIPEYCFSSQDLFHSLRAGGHRSGIDSLGIGCSGLRRDRCWSSGAVHLVLSLSSNVDVLYQRSDRVALEDNQVQDTLVAAAEEFFKVMVEVYNQTRKSDINVRHCCNL